MLEEGGLTGILRHLLAAILACLVVSGPVGIGVPVAWTQEMELDGTRPLADPLVCLARTIYFEAGGQSETEMAAVGHVVMNRVRSSAFPGDVCAVIRQGGEAGPCQFSWWCDGRSDVATDRAEYDRVVAVARDILQGKLSDPTNGANMFHNLGVTPSWAKAAKLRARIGEQVFYYLKN